MSKNTLSVIPIEAPVKKAQFDLLETLVTAVSAADAALQDGDILALSSKYVAISEGRVLNLDEVQPGDKAYALAARYKMDARIAQLVYDEADHIFGGIQMGFLLTWKNGVMSPNAGLDRSNIPSGKVVLLPARPYETAAQMRRELRQRLGVDVGVVLTDSWLVPARWGTTGLAIGVAGFKPVKDERGKIDLFGNPMAVTQVGVADSISACAQMVMGERDEATPIAIVRNSGVPLTDDPVSMADVAIPWQMCIYVESLTLGLLPDGAPPESLTAKALTNGMSAGD